MLLADSSVAEEHSNTSTATTAPTSSEQAKYFGSRFVRGIKFISTTICDNVRSTCPLIHHQQAIWAEPEKAMMRSTRRILHALMKD